mgnify:CR=1 FL=1
MQSLPHIQKSRRHLTHSVSNYRPTAPFHLSTAVKVKVKTEYRACKPSVSKSRWSVCYYMFLSTKSIKQSDQLLHKRVTLSTDGLADRWVSYLAVSVGSATPQNVLDVSISPTPTIMQRCFTSHKYIINVASSVSNRRKKYREYKEFSDICAFCRSSRQRQSEFPWSTYNLVELGVTNNPQYFRFTGESLVTHQIQ